VFYTGLYGQDEWQASKNLRLTLGLRLDVPFFGDTGFKNAEVDNLNFMDENGNTVKYATDKLLMRIFFGHRESASFDVTGDRRTRFEVEQVYSLAVRLTYGFQIRSVKMEF
jgi:outer membrane receptor protein involved in Fe transport